MAAAVLAGAALELRPISWLRRVYRVVSDPQAEADGDLRVVDESGEGYLHPANYFLVLVLAPDQAAALAASYVAVAS